MTLAHGPLLVTNGLVFYVDGANSRSYPGSGATWYDLSGYGNHAALQNSPTYSNSNGGYLQFNGSNQHALMGTNGFSFGSDPGTLACWAATNTISGGYSWPISYGLDSTAASRSIGINNTTYVFAGYVSDITADGLVPLSTWFYMVGVYDGANASIYINGTLVSGPTALSWNTVSYTAQIGRQTNGSEYWNGNISIVQIYNRGLSASEILQNFNAQRGRYGV